MIKDALKDIKLTKEFNPYISNYRIFIYLILAYFDGNIEAAVDKNFLQEIGINVENLDQEIAEMVAFVMFLVKSYALCLGNPQYNERFYTFYSFIFNRKQIILALDFVLLQYLFAILKKYTSVSPSIFMGNFLKDIIYILNIEEAKIDAESIYDRKKALGILTSYIGLMS